MVMVLLMVLLMVFGAKIHDVSETMRNLVISICNTVAICSVGFRGLGLDWIDWIVGLLACWIGGLVVLELSF